MIDDELALLGGSDEPTPEEQKRADRIFRAKLSAAAAGRGEIKSRDLIKPVTQNTISEVFGMDSETVRKRLAHCPIAGTSGTRDLYDFKTACQYILEPKMDVETYLKTLNPAKMPPTVNKALWDGMRGKLRYQAEAGEAWATEDVLDVLSNTALIINDRTRLWVEQMRDMAFLGDEQLRKFEELIDEYKATLHAELVEVAKNGRTRSLIQDADEFLQTGE